jgi:putative ABC transport system ATP-binding protein
VLDSLTAATATTLRRARAAAGTAVLVATHSPELASAADRLVPLRDGRVEA